MEKEVYLTILYDYYGELLSDKNREYFENYYFLNLSLGEIAENLGVSRNAIHKQLKLIEDKLINYEKVLKQYERDLKLNEIIEQVNDEKIKSLLTDLL